MIAEEAAQAEAESIATRWVPAHMTARQGLVDDIARVLVTGRRLVEEAQAERDRVRESRQQLIEAAAADNKERAAERDRLKGELADMTAYRDSIKSELAESEKVVEHMRIAVQAYCDSENAIRAELAEARDALLAIQNCNNDCYLCDEHQHVPALSLPPAKPAQPTYEDGEGKPCPQLNTERLISATPIKAAEQAQPIANDEDVCADDTCGTTRGEHHKFVEPAEQAQGEGARREPIFCDTPGCGKPIPIGGEGHPEICPDCLVEEASKRTSFKYDYSKCGVPFETVDSVARHESACFVCALAKRVDGRLGALEAWAVDMYRADRMHTAPPGWMGCHRCNQLTVARCGTCDERLCAGHLDCCREAPPPPEAAGPVECQNCGKTGGRVEQIILPGGRMSRWTCPHCRIQDKKPEAAGPGHAFMPLGYGPLTKVLCAFCPGTIDSHAPPGPPPPIPGRAK